MITKEYRTLDKSSWPKGPWQDEPDKVQWEDEATGLPCLAVRRNPQGFLCGYVGVTQGHPLFGLGYMETEAKYEIDVHGGLTFAESCQEEGDPSRSICHIVDEGEDDAVWWLGFDCAHGDDIWPNPIIPPYPDATYKTLTYVQQECASLAAQIKEVAS